MHSDNDGDAVVDELSRLLTLKNARPYVFRTRLERTLLRVNIFADIHKFNDVKACAGELLFKLSYISDQSNQTSDGVLKSFVFLESDIRHLLDKCVASLAL